jgi:hypothetical protein
MATRLRRAMRMQAMALLIRLTEFMASRPAR